MLREKKDKSPCIYMDQCNLKDMFANLVPADDLVFRYGTDAPTIRIDGMTVAGV